MMFDIHTHGRRYRPVYPPHDHSDHLPMAWLAMGGLGADDSRRAAFTAEHLPQLEALEPGSPHHHRVEHLAEEMHDRGIAAVLQDRLPGLISGWYREAYHPVIRLAYGVEFRIFGEAAAGLAYLEQAGASTRVEALAAGADLLPGTTGIELLQRAAASGIESTSAELFDERATSALEAPGAEGLAKILDNNLAQMSQAALAAFVAPHNFFALHLVTGSHAFRILYPWAGPNADAIMNLGLLAGYLAIGAPPIDAANSQPQAPDVGPKQLLEACRNNEHDVKLAYSCWQQAEHWKNPDYVSTAMAYLS
jgi:hypothetical protein